jgi:hypothetical protein
MDFLALEEAIITRLRETLPETLRVLSALDLATVAKGTLPAPSVHVIYDGYDIVEQNPARWRMVQRWLTVVCVRSVTAVQSGAGSRDAAGPLLGDVVASLHHWQPAVADLDARSLEIDSAPRPGYTAGSGFFPLAWTTTVTVKTHPENY